MEKFTMSVCPRIASRCAIALLFAGLFCGLSACIVAQAQAVPASQQTADAAYKWREKGGYYYCLRDGKPLKGLNDVAGKTYYFDGKGRQRTGWRKVGKSYRYFKIANGAAGSQVSSKVVNGIKLKKDGTASFGPAGKQELSLMCKAGALADTLTKPGWKKAKKLRACFSYLIHDCGLAVYHKFSSRAGWHRAFARDIFDKKRGDCNSYGAAYAYLACAVGAKRVCIVASGGHGWTEVEGKVCDGQWAHGGRWRYYNFPLSESGRAGAPAYAKNRVHVVRIAPRTRTWGKAVGAVDGASARTTGLRKVGGHYRLYRNGKKVAGRWDTWKGKRYYFKANGNAVTGPAKVRPSNKGAAAKRWFVFSAKGALLTGTKTRVVSVSGKRYRVAKSGAAVAGWLGRQRYFFANGEMACGVCLLKGKLYAFSSSGIYDAVRTAGLQRAHAASRAKSAYASGLIGLLGRPVSVWAGATCFTMTDPFTGIVYDASNAEDVLYKYEHVTVSTMRSKADPSVEFLEDVTAA